MRRLVVAILTLLVIAGGLGSNRPAFAQEEPPARVGRVSFLSGQMGFHAVGETEWSAASVNFPVATGGSFWTDPKTRAEVRIGSQTIGLSGDTEIDLTRLDEQVTQIALPQGRIGLRLRRLAQGDSVEVDVPRGGVWLLQPGVYDIDAGSPDRPTRIMVFEGSARFVGGSVDQGVNAGEAAVISGTDTLTVALERAAPDAFVEWCRSRDYQEQRLAAPYHVSPRMTGYEDLDQYGSWGDVPQYGQVWYPSSVPADWAPYREGHWVSVAPWGWTWVDAAPWGFAPFHYGRWARIHNRWGWIPGRFVAQPVYAPALVAFIGAPGGGYARGGGGWGGGGFGWRGARGPTVGWFPLGPNEVYVPSYSRNPTYIRNVNITNVSETRITNITNIIVNRPVAANGRAGGPPPQAVNQNFANRAAATVVPVQTFASAAKVAPAAIRVPPQALQQARIGVPPPPAPAPKAASPQVASPQVASPSGRVAPSQPPATPGAAVPTPPGIHPPGTAAPGPVAGPHPPGTPASTAPVIKPPAGELPKPAAVHVPGPPIQAPPKAEHQVPAAVHVPPPPVQAPPVQASPKAERPGPAAVHVPPPPVQAPPVQAPPKAEHPAPAAVHVPPPPVQAPPVQAPPKAEHRAPAAIHVPPPVQAPPPVVHAPPAAVRVPPPAAQAPPPVVHAPPAAVRVPPPTVARPPPVVHAPPPVVHAPPPVVHAPPPAVRAPAPAPAPHPAAAPAAAPRPAAPPPGKAPPKKEEQKQ